jgi:hypothetical protein
VLQAQVALGVVLLHVGEDLCLAEHGAGGVRLAELDQLQGHLLVQVLQLAPRELQVGNLGEHLVPTPVVDIRHEGLDAVHGVERDLALVLQARRRRRGGGAHSTMSHSSMVPCGMRMQSQAHLYGVERLGEGVLLAKLQDDLDHAASQTEGHRSPIKC